MTTAPHLLEWVLSLLLERLQIEPKLCVKPNLHPQSYLDISPMICSFFDLSLQCCMMTWDLCLYERAVLKCTIMYYYVLFKLFLIDIHQEPRGNVRQSQAHHKTSGTCTMWKCPALKEMYSRTERLRNLVIEVYWKRKTKCSFIVYPQHQDKHDISYLVSICRMPICIMIQ